MIILVVYSEKAYSPKCITVSVHATRSAP